MSTAASESAQLGEAFGEQAQHGALAGAGIAGDEGKAAFANLTLFDAPAETLDLWGNE